ncbi:MAG: TldD/PmbA family protein [Candidatus Thorarchaeota archaeon]
MFDLLDKAMDKGRSLGADYIELRGESGFVEFIQMEDGRVNALTQRIERGVAIRVLADGAWGFVSTGNVDELDKSIVDAYKMAKAGAPTRREPIELAEIKAHEDVVKAKLKRNPRDVPIEEKINYLTEMTKVIKDYDSRITASTVELRTASGQQYLVTNQGTRIETPISLVWAAPRATGKDGTRLSGARHIDASTQEGWEYIEKTATPEVLGQTVGKRVKLQLEGVPAKAGSFPCVLGPHVIGVVAHEALGHLAEADLTVQSAFNGKVGEVVAAEGVNMTDDGTDIGNLGTAKYDAEGVPPSRVEIIKDSVLTELMTNREFAAKNSQRTTGNARAESYLFAPIIRMRNTYFERGTYSEDELFEGIKFGYYCTSYRGGQAQMNASFQVGTQEVYEIVNGEIGQSVIDLSISGIATESLFKIEAISKEEFPFAMGQCGKGQDAYTSSGGPNIRFAKGGITFGGKN